MRKLFNIIYAEDDHDEVVEGLISHFGGCSSGIVGDAIIKYLRSSDCSPKTRRRIKEELNDEFYETTSRSN